MNSLVWALIVFILGEIVGLLFFYLINRSFKKSISLAALFRGWLERAFLFTSLISGVPQAFILFGALKIGTRFKDEDGRVSNDYFLIGNLISAFMVIIYFLVWKHFTA